jgi:hypothetical protein
MKVKRRSGLQHSRIGWHLSHQERLPAEASCCSVVHSLIEVPAKGTVGQLQQPDNRQLPQP